MTPTLNWREIAHLISDYRGRLEGPGNQNVFVDRIIVPERTYYPGGYIKGEWVVRLTSRRGEWNLLFSVRTRQPYLALSEGKGPKAAAHATRSPFDLALSKHLKGARFLGMEAFERERTVALWFTAEGRSETEERLGLVLSLIPATPEALLVRDLRSERESAASARSYPVLARSRTLRDVDAAVAARFVAPDGARAPAEPPLRLELVRDAETFARVVEDGLRREAFGLRLREVERTLRDRAKQARERIRQTETALHEARGEPDWLRMGNLLKGMLEDPPPLVTEATARGPRAVRRAYDFESGEYVDLVCDPKLGPQAQVEKFFNSARRKGRRIQESEARLETFREALSQAEGLLAHPPAEGDWKGLEKFERVIGVAPPSAAPAAAGADKKKQQKGWLGKTFVSRDGMTFWVGRSKDENLELTFKIARGNDVWMHVRGKPGAHTVIPVPSGKSVPLETLLDAAVLTVYYSGGEKWGKTEVDYTFKKYVKRIKDSTEASYTNNKTLIVEPEQARIKRLLGSA